MHDRYMADGVLFLMRRCSKMSRSENITDEVKSAQISTTVSVFPAVLLSRCHLFSSDGASFIWLLHHREKVSTAGTTVHNTKCNTSPGQFHQNVQ